MTLQKICDHMWSCQQEPESHRNASGVVWNQSHTGLKRRCLLKWTGCWWGHRRTACSVAPSALCGADSLPLESHRLRGASLAVGCRSKSPFASLATWESQDRISRLHPEKLQLYTESIVKNLLIPICSARELMSSNAFVSQQDYTTLLEGSSWNLVEGCVLNVDAESRTFSTLSLTLLKFIFVNFWE